MYRPRSKPFEQSFSPTVPLPSKEHAASASARPTNRGFPVLVGMRLSRLAACVGLIALLVGFRRSTHGDVLLVIQHALYLILNSIGCYHFGLQLGV